ncbi:MAG: GspE/PulE family protein [Cytophagales bacterium]|nr:GspE/PulE family protein [Cytophagales bacterium]
MNTLPSEVSNGLLRKTDRELADKLLAEKHLSSSELGIAMAEQKRLGGQLHSHITRLGLMSVSILRDIRANLLQLPVVDIAAQRPDPTIERLISGALARYHKMLPVAKSNTGRVLLAVSDPHDLIGIDQVTAHLRSQGVVHVKLGLAAETELHREIDRVFGERISVESILATGGREPPIEKIVEAILQQAYDSEASDIHFEPDEYFLRVRLRIDGILKQSHLLHASIWSGLAVKLKVLAGMNIAESRLPQDGRFGFQLGINDIDFRAACLPTAHGENIVLRLLDKNKNIVPFKRVDISDHARRCINAAVAKPEGIVLVTGPTGSGKTTTLYSVLSSVSNEDVNVMTLEDPIEYPLPLIRQTQITEKLTFADGVRALMRQDPDVILVGEIRDQETAEMAFRAAMTGHQVFATLHTNSALAAVQRLRDIGVSSEILAGNMIGVIGQRLSRKLCVHCKAPAQLSPHDQQLLGVAIGDATKTHIYKAVGCAHCSQSGYRGRFVLMEVLIFDEKMDELVATNASPPELARYARSAGFVTLRDDAIRRVLAGDSTIEEVSRVVSLVQR